jgi:DinB superfamily
MQYSLNKSAQILERTPAVLKALLLGVDEEWLMSNEGPETFSPYDVVGHLIHGEKTDWTERTKMVLEFGTSKPFEPYDRFAQFEESKGKSIEQLLAEFEVLRKKNMEWLQSLNLTDADLEKKGMHPSLGEVNLKNLLSTWVVHDLTHIAQVTRVMAKQYKEEMGPWPQYFRVLSF